MYDFSKLVVMDRYTVMARVLPACIVAFPFALVAYAWSPFDLNYAKGTTAAAAFACVAYALSHIVRDAGKRLEERLVQAWGGWPSTAVLRHRDLTFDEVTKARFHRRLVECGAVAAMPTEAEESADPGKADATFASAATWLRGQTRDKKAFPLIFEENINYGFVRNLLGSRWYALTGAGLCTVLDGLLFWLGRSAGGPAILSVAYAFVLLAGVNKSGLHRLSFTYARRLVESIDALNAPKSKSKPRSRKPAPATP